MELAQIKLGSVQESSEIQQISGATLSREWKKQRGVEWPAIHNPILAAKHCYALVRSHDQEGNYSSAFNLGRWAGEFLLRHEFGGSVDINSALKNLKNECLMRSSCIHLSQCHDEEMDDRPPPVFILGFPGSGADLVARMLGDYPGVHVCRSTGALSLVRKTLDEYENSDCNEISPGQLIRKLRAIYWRRLSEHDCGIPDPLVICDYDPCNILELPLINALFPGARVIYSWRDPRDACLTAFLSFFDFKESTPLLKDWEMVVTLYAAIDKQYAQLEHRLDLRLYPVRYESLVAEPRSGMAAILRFVGISWLTAYKTYPCFSETASKYVAYQLSGWKNYIRYLNPVGHILDHAIDRQCYQAM